MHLSWQIGDVTITRLLELEMPVAYTEKGALIKEATPAALKEIPWLYPNHVTEDGSLRLSIHALLIEADGLKLIVDTCFGNDKPSALTGGKALQTAFLEDLTALGWQREQVDLVVCTHLHIDHVGWNTMKQGDNWVPTFPNARYLMGEDEYNYWRKSEATGQKTVMAASVTPVFDAGLVDLVATNHQISPSVRLVPTIGHTPGHVSVMIESAGERAMITGDFMHNPCQIARPDWCASFDEDPQAAAATRWKILKQVADSSTLVIGTHFATPTAGKIVSDGSSFRFSH